MNSPTSPLRCLLVEDSADDALLVLRQLRAGGYDVTSERVDTPEAMHAALARSPWDIILSDYRMPQFNGLDALAILRASGLDLPFIVVSGRIGEEVAVAAMKAGAHDYLMKDNLDRLAPAVVRELRYARERQEHRTLQRRIEDERNRLGALLRSMSDEVWYCDTHGVFTLINPAGRSRFNLAEDEPAVVQELAASLEVRRADGSLRPIKEAPPLRALAGEVVSNQEEMVRLPPKGELRHRLVNATPVRDANGAIIGSISVVRDITVQKRAAAAQRDSEQLFHQFMDQLPGLAYIKDSRGQVLFANQGFATYLGLEPPDLVGRTTRNIVPAEFARQAEANDQQVLASGQAVEIEEDLADRNWLTRKFPINTENETRLVGGLTFDITERRKSEAALRRQTEELRTHNEDLERFNRLAVGRELRMIELKQEINELCQRLGEAPRHPLSTTPAARSADGESIPAPAPADTA